VITSTKSTENQFSLPGSYFVASCGGVTVEQIKKYVEQQATPEL
jgi:REP element-mobilizing transposase RayT